MIKKFLQWLARKRGKTPASLQPIILKDGVLQEVSPEEGMAYLSKLLTESGEAKSDKE